jgi:hypothetical protein
MARRRLGGFVRDFADGFNTTNGLVRDIALSNASANVKPEAIESTQLNETTPDTKDMVYDQDSGQYLPRYMNPDGTSTDQAIAQQNAYAGSESPEGVSPTFNAQTNRKYRMGNQVQDAPFRQEQIDAQRLRNQADVYSNFGQPEKSVAVQGLVKAKNEEDTQQQIRQGASDGLKSTKDVREEEKLMTMAKGMYETAMRLNRPDLAAGYYNQMTQSRDALMARTNDRAERIYRSTGNVSGYVDSYNRYMADGHTIDAFKQGDDGSHTLTLNDGSGNTRDITVPKEKIGDWLLALRDPKRVSEIEQQRAQTLYKAQADAQEKLNTPVAVGKDQTLVVPATGQTFAPRHGGQFDVKEANPVLDDARKMILERSSNFDPTTGKWNWSPEAAAKASTAERLFMANPSLTPAMLAEIADKGSTGTAVVEVNGKQQRVPAVSHNGRTFMLGGSDAGQVTQQPDVSGQGTRDVRGKISATPGLSRATPPDFPRVSSAQQAQRDSDRRFILQRELETTPRDGSQSRRALEEEARRAGISVPA